MLDSMNTAKNHLTASVNFFQAQKK